MTFSWPWQRVDLSPSTRRVIQNGLFLLAFVASFIWNQDYNLLLGLVALAGLTLAMVMTDPRLWAQGVAGRPPLIQAVFIIMALLWAWVWVRAATSDVMATSIMAAGFYGLPLFLAAWIAVARPLTHLKPILLPMLGLGAALAVVGIVIGLLNRYAGLGFGDPYRIDWPMQSSNHLAMILNATILTGLGLVLAGRVPRWGWVLVTLCFVATLFTGSRAGLITLGLGMMVLFIIAWPKVKATWHSVRHQRWFWGLVVMATIGLAVVAPRLGQSFLDLFLIFNDTTGERWSMYLGTLGLIMDRPLFGFGTGTYVHIYPLMAEPHYLSGGWAAHNDALQMAVETGVIGLVLYGALAIAVMILAFKTLPALHDPTRRLVAGTALAVLTTVMGHGQIEFTLMVVPVTIIQGLALGVLIQALDPRDPAPLSAAPNHRATAVLFVAMVVSLISMMQTMAQFYNERADRALGRGDVQNFARHLARSTYYSLDLQSYPYLRTAQYKFWLALGGQMADPALLTEIDQAIQQARARNPYSSMTYEVEGRLAALRGEDPEPIWQRGLALEPRNADLRLNLLQYYEQRGQKQKAAALAQETKEWRTLRGNLPALHRALAAYP